MLNYQIARMLLMLSSNRFNMCMSSSFEIMICLFICCSYRHGFGSSNMTAPPSLNLLAEIRLIKWLYCGID
ncbi:Protein of unknown function, partial [Gryllus bimaculatus]